MEDAGNPKYSNVPDRYPASSLPVDIQFITSLAEPTAPIQNNIDNPENEQT